MPDLPALPDAIDRYLAAQDRRDHAAALATFAPDAIVVDDGRRFEGHGAIEAWLTGAASEYTFTRTLVAADAGVDSTWIVRNRLEGNFPGGVVDLSYRFTLADAAITELVIAP